MSESIYTYKTQSDFGYEGDVIWGNSVPPSEQYWNSLSTQPNMLVESIDDLPYLRSIAPPIDETPIGDSFAFILFLSGLYGLILLKKKNKIFVKKNT